MFCAFILMKADFMTISPMQQLNNISEADFKLSLASDTNKVKYLASGVDYYAPQTPQNTNDGKVKFAKNSVPYFIASTLGFIALCAFMPEIRLKLSNTKHFKDIDNLHKIEKSDKFLSNLKLGFMEIINFVSDKVMEIRTSFKARKM